jgi:methylphosphotriester-DNA--protein-cysteine methyltransferase
MEGILGLDRGALDRARASRDARFDGKFFIAVTSTGIYCRPVCPAPSAKKSNVRYYPTAAAAAEAGFRPCLRCRPEAAPGTPAWLGTSAVVRRALRLIQEGALDEISVDELAERIGIGPRHLHRLFTQHVGASPIAVAQTRRVHFAKRLLDETDLPITQIALAAGFGSLRRFNDTFQKTYKRSPRELRRKRGHLPPSAAGDEVVLTLGFRPPYDWKQVQDFLAARALPGVERVDERGYARTACARERRRARASRARRSADRFVSTFRGRPAHVRPRGRSRTHRDDVQRRCVARAARSRQTWTAHSGRMGSVRMRRARCARSASQRSCCENIGWTPRRPRRSGDRQRRRRSHSRVSFAGCARGRRPERPGNHRQSDRRAACACTSGGRRTSRLRRAGRGRDHVADVVAGVRRVDCPVRGAPRARRAGRVPDRRSGAASDGRHCDRTAHREATRRSRRNLAAVARLCRAASVARRLRPTSAPAHSEEIGHLRAARVDGVRKRPVSRLGPAYRFDRVSRSRAEDGS